MSKQIPSSTALPSDQSSGPETRISRRKVLQATAAPLALAMASRSAQAQSARPNIVFIMADDLGYADLSVYGRREYLTPNIDSLATDGMRFLQAYANSSVCSATRVALMTGRYQYRLEAGLAEPLTYGEARLGLPPEHPTIPSILKASGYQTALVGKWHLGNLPNYGPAKSGYDHFWGIREGGVDYFTHKYGAPDTDTLGLWDGDTLVDEAGYLTELMGDKAVEMIDEFTASDAPFFLSLHFTAPHWPWEGPDDEAISQGIRAITHYDGGTMQTYAEMVTSLDDQVGRVLAKLDEAGISQNTIVIFTSDNGGERFSDTWPFSGMKQELLEGGLRIPSLVRWPARVPSGSVTEQVSMTMDWLPTLLAAAGLEPDPAYPPDGINLLPQLTGSADPVSRRVYWRYNANAQRAVRDGDMKWLKIRDNDFLFNVVEDPLERGNLKNRQPEVYQRLIADYEEWNATMLPDEPRNFGGNTARNVAERFGNGAPAPPAAAPKPEP